MKFKILITLATLIIASASFAKDMAHYRFTVPGFEKGQYHSLETVITEDQELKVKVVTTTGRFPFFIPEDGSAETFDASKRLNDIVFKMLKDEIIGLSRAKIESRTNVIVCMVMPGPGMMNNHLSVLRQYDYETNEFTEEMKLILGPQGCWVSNPTYPKEQYQMNQAKNLKSTMKLLALELVGDDL